MGIVYYHSSQEKIQKTTEIQKKGFKIFHDDFVDENGRDTSGTSGRLIFGTEEQQKNSFEYRFTKPNGDFFKELESIRTLNNVYPLMYESYEKITTGKLKEKLGIDAKDKTPSQLLSLYHLRLWQKLQYLTSEQRRSYEQDDIDKLIIELGKNKMFLPRSQDFVREMGLVYLISIFQAYVINIVIEVFRNYTDLLQSAPTKYEFQKIIVSGDEKLFEEKLYDFVSWELVSHGINNLAEKFKEFFDCDLKRNDWEEFTEYFERRNILVHHNGMPTQKYKKKFPQYSNESKLLVSKDYLIKGIKLFEIYEQGINGFFWPKYGVPIYLKEMS